MRPLGPAAVAVACVVIAAVIVGAVFLVGGLESGPGSVPHAFSYTENLPTGTIAYNGQLDCGSNVTLNLTLPSNAVLYYNLSVNTSGGSANVWEIGAGLHAFTAVPYGGTTEGTIGLGATGGTLEFFFQGCGSTPTVVLAFWGYFASSLDPGVSAR
jgi:hypothetical protein